VLSSAVVSSVVSSTVLSSAVLSSAAVSSAVSSVVLLSLVVSLVVVSLVVPEPSSLLLLDVQPARAPTHRTAARASARNRIFFICCFISITSNLFPKKGGGAGGPGPRGRPLLSRTVYR